MSFASLGLAPELLHALSEQGLRSPTPVQTLAIPAVLRGDDLLCRAPTGSGKTLAYALPLLQGLQISRRPWPRRTQALVLLPTRELAQQVGGVLEDLARRLPEPPKVVTAIGGLSINPQLMALRGGAEVVVATPGRLLDLLDHNGLRLQALSTLVLDEADRLLDLGFAEEWAAIRSRLPPLRARADGRTLQQLLFSATLDQAVRGLADALLQRPLTIDLSGIEPAATLGADGGDDAATARAAAEPAAVALPHPDIQQRAIVVDTTRRTGALRRLLTDHPEWDAVLVFVGTRMATERVAHKLSLEGLHAAPLHGEMSQGARDAVLADFRLKRLRVLVTTDLAARGLDIAGLPLVVNYDLPRAAADHVHRIGRTGRGGTAGTAISFVTPAGEAHFRVIEKRQQQRVPREVLPGYEPTEVAPPPPVDGNGGIKGRRPSKKDKLRAAATAAAAGGSGPRPPRR
ncbi:DEAD/DEAH box helicase [Leptothrix discophora]|uniref:DEAD/DEAH box helicase n=1 Tax=Leptothrix discophora TaxID=89 RepID=A0ABT9G840_LEPDI|nr:DEAD/DEAH box helicase [Leptothrix discophora]MDP4302358.1 DEAD/DEAH box helicase [Leptothrix discophora]